MPAVRALPARPNLEFEKKAAKTLLKRLREGDPDARARAELQHAELGGRAPEEFQLADAQLVTAREYGFASWPKMVRYFNEVELVTLAPRPRQNLTGGRAEHEARALVREHAARHLWAARRLAAYVPRFYGLDIEEVFALPVSDEEARLAVARQHGYSSWQDFLAAPTEMSDKASWHPLAMSVSHALRQADLDTLKAIAAKHPEIHNRETPTTFPALRILREALAHERYPGGRDAMRPIIRWLVDNGHDLQGELDLQLCGRMRAPTGEIRWLLERGANPNWIAPNGIPILEIALLVFWNGEAVDLIAQKAGPPRRALWIAAGLGDVEGVRHSLDANGKPLPKAVALRPPFDAVGAPSLASHPEAGDEELLMEALFVAAINGRIGVIKYLASRGAPIDSQVYGGTLLSFAVGNGLADVVEVLVDAGADLDIPTGDSNGTPREMGRSWFRPGDPMRRRIAALCGWDPDRLTAEHRGAE
jgi:hypothetical protein